MSTPETHARLRELRASFEGLALTTTGLSILPASSTHADDTAGEFTMRLVGTGSPEVRLRVRTDVADLTARSGSDHPRAGTAEIRDALGVELATGFAWDDSACSSADELAGLLLKHMRRRLKAVAEVTPGG